MLKTLIDFYQNRSKEQIISEIIALFVVLSYAVLSKHFFNFSEENIGIHCVLLGALLYVLIPLSYCFFLWLTSFFSSSSSKIYKSKVLISSKNRINFPTTYVWEKISVGCVEYIADDYIYVNCPIPIVQNARHDKGLS